MSDDKTLRKTSNDTTDKILEGLQLAYKKLVEHKRKTNGVLVIMKDGKITHLRP